MDEQQLKDYFVDLESLLQGYYEEHMSSIVDEEYETLQKNKREEYEKAQERTPYMPSLSGVPLQQYAATTAVVTSGVWYRRNTDYLLGVCNERFSKIPFAKHDLSELTAGFNDALVKKIGQEKYDELSSKYGMDLASYYVQGRVNGMFLEQLADLKMPKSEFQYILEKGVMDSLPAFLMMSAVPDYKSDLDKTVDYLSEERYNPSTAAKVTGFMTSNVIDYITLGGVGKGASLLRSGGQVASNTVGHTLKNFAKFTGADLLVREGVSLISGLGDDGFSEAIFGSRKALEEYQVEASERYSLSNTDRNGPFGLFRRGSYVLKTNDGNYVGSTFANKLKTRYEGPEVKVDKEEVKAFTNRLTEAYSSSPDVLFGNLRGVLETNYILDKDKDIPEEMLSMSESKLSTCSAYYASLALHMTEKHIRFALVNGHHHTDQDVAQMSYDYSRALEHVRSERLSNGDVQDESMTHEVAGGNSVSDGRTVEGETAAVAVQQQSVSGWNSVLDSLGLSGFGDVGKNLGYVLAMLPDLLIGMFTGQTKRLNISDNLMPIAAIFGGMFVKNPILKMLLIGLGGANLLNKAGHEALDHAGIKSDQPRQYKIYQDEDLDRRIKNPAMQGNTLIADIDGKPLVIPISDMAVDAYYKGALPLNTLSNAVLRAWDRQQETLAQNYEQGVAEEQQITRSRGIQ